MTPDTIAFCPACGGELVERYVDVEERERLVCVRCARIHYQNPNVVAGLLPVSDGQIWLLRRAIAPRYGMWTFPAGFMELGETVEQAAMRETREELNMQTRIVRLLNVYSRPAVPTVLVVYLADVLSQPTGGRETLNFARFAPADLPWQSLAFWNTEAALRDWLVALESPA